MQHLSNEFWAPWKEYLLELQQRNKWTGSHKDLQTGDIVIIKDEDVSHNGWELSRVIKTKESEDGCIQSVQLLLADSSLDDSGKRIKARITLRTPHPQAGPAMMRVIRNCRKEESIL